MDVQQSTAQLKKEGRANARSNLIDIARPERVVLEILYCWHVRHPDRCHGGWKQWVE